MLVAYRIRAGSQQKHDKRSEIYPVHRRIRIRWQTDVLTLKETLDLDLDPINPKGSNVVTLNSKVLALQKVQSRVCHNIPNCKIVRMFAAICGSVRAGNASAACTTKSQGVYRFEVGVLAMKSDPVDSL